MPSVAFESTVFAHGLPSPYGLETALLLEEIAREEGALVCVPGPGRKC